LTRHFTYEKKTAVIGGRKPDVVSVEVKNCPGYFPFRKFSRWTRKHSVNYQAGNKSISRKPFVCFRIFLFNSKEVKNVPACTM